MTDPPVLDVEVEDTTRPFRVITHKPGLAAGFAKFGGTQDVGVVVDSSLADQTLWWMSQDWAIQVLKAGIELPQLLAPTPGWLAGPLRRFMHRKVGTLLKRDVPRFFAQNLELLSEHPQVVLSVPGEHPELLAPQLVPAADLAVGLPAQYAALPDATLLQLDEPLSCVAEVRCWVAHGTVTTFAPYRLGVVGWDSNLFLEMLFNTEGQKLTEGAVDTAKVIAAEVDGPPGYALDIGVTVDGITTVLRVWPAWAAEPLHADPSGVFTALVAAHDFDHVAEKWRWKPDRNVYARPQTATPDQTKESPDEQ